MLRFAVVILSLSFLFAVVDDVAAADKAEFRAGAATSNITRRSACRSSVGFRLRPRRTFTTN